MTKSINRRGFLKTGIAGAAGMVTFAPSIASASAAGSENDNIIYRTLGKTGLKVPVISFGVMNSDNPNLCKAAYEKGIKLFDTANGYQNGNNEAMLGNLLKDYNRDSFFLSTKARPNGVDKDGNPSKETTAESFLEKFNISLSRLKMDYVDILYIHAVQNPELIECKPIVNALKKLKKEGKIRFMGFSTHRNEAAVINAAASTDDWDVILTSYNFMHTNITELNSAIRKANEKGIGIVAMKTLAGGGFFDKEKKKPINTTAALKWVLSNPDIHTTIPGMTTFDQLDLNAKIMYDISMTEVEKKGLVVPTAETGLFCTGCSKCIPACPRNLPVPDLMRAYMYAYGYSNTSKAHSLLGELGINDNPCKGCDTCKVECTKHFRIKEKITDISRLVDVPEDFLS
ncbi:MAG: aldo/keto reductase [Bacteroidales bacterium]|nr:aldo/keto reductase [Bacteroidales bacterium]